MTAGGGLFAIRFHFRGDLPFFVRPKPGVSQFVRQRRGKTSVKDAIEACGVPHPEVDLILINGAPVTFRHCLESDAAIDVYPVSAGADLFPKARLQQRGVARFVADGHLGKLTRDLRLLGIDVAYRPVASDAELVALSVAENRALLTRDRLLLMRAAVASGYYPRSQMAREQTREVLDRFDLRGIIAPFARCLRCNGSLVAVSKSDVLDKLEPLTKIHYEVFRRCRQCGQIYWSGSHFEKLQKRVERLLGDQK